MLLIDLERVSHSHMQARVSIINIFMGKFIKTIVFLVNFESSSLA